MNQSLTLNYVSADTALPDDPYWLTITQDVKDDRATVADVAEIVDSLYESNPCIEKIDATPPKEPDQETLISSASKLDLVECDRRLNDKGDYKAILKVVRSHTAIPYKLILSVGKVVGTAAMMETITVAVDVKSASSVVLESPVVSPETLRAFWLGSVIGSDGPVVPPVLRLHHNTLFWSGSVTGTIKVTYATTSDLVTCEIPGVPDKNPDVKTGTPQESNALVFYHYQTYQCPIAVPTVDTKADLPTLAEVCGWTNFSFGNSVPPKPPEPPTPPEDPCLFHNEIIANNQITKYLCCHDMPFCQTDGLGAPDCTCEFWKSGSVPGKELPESVKALYEQGHNGTVEFVGVSPRGKDGCGGIYTRINVSQKDCCKEVTPVVITSTLLTVAPGGTIILGLTGGLPPYTWQSSVLTKLWETSSSAAFQAPSSFCGTGDVIVADSCGSMATARVQSTSGVWKNVAFSECSSPIPGRPPVDQSVYPFVAQSLGYRVGYAHDSAGATGYPYSACGIGESVSPAVWASLNLQTRCGGVIMYTKADGSPADTCTDITVPAGVGIGIYSRRFCGCEDMCTTSWYDYYQGDPAHCVEEAGKSFWVTSHYVAFVQEWSCP